MVKCLNIGKHIGKPIYRSISSLFHTASSISGKKLPTLNVSQMFVSVKAANRRSFWSYVAFRSGFI